MKSIRFYLFEIKRVLIYNSTFFKLTKELSLWNKIKYLNLNIFRTRCCKPLIFQTQIILSNRIHSLKYLRSTTFGSKVIVIRVCGKDSIPLFILYFFIQNVMPSKKYKRKKSKILCLVGQIEIESHRFLIF